MNKLLTASALVLALSVSAPASAQNVRGGFQGPGKTFYRMNTNQNILVIADGSHREELKTYLSRYNRFLICNNDKDDIKVAVQKLMKSGPFHCSNEFLRLLSPEYVSSKIIEGDML